MSMSVPFWSHRDLISEFGAWAIRWHQMTSGDPALPKYLMTGIPSIPCPSLKNSTLHPTPDSALILAHHPQMVSPPLSLTWLTGPSLIPLKISLPDIKNVAVLLLREVTRNVAKFCTLWLISAANIQPQRQPAWQYCITCCWIYA